MNRRAFTLIELMLVVIIIGILSAMVVPRLASRSEQARKATAAADVSGAIPLALDLFEVDNGRYPTTEEGLAALRQKPGGLDRWKGPYLKKSAKDPWGNDYVYRFPGSHNNNDYDLFSKGPDGSENTEDDITNW